jgi:DNA-directed RNA polymerase subunit delta
MTQSMLEVAYTFVKEKKEPVTFNEIWAIVQKKLPDISKGQVARFYKLLTLDGRFVALGGNKWDLKTHYTFKQLYDDARGVFKDVEEIETPLDDEDVEEDPFAEDDDELGEDEKEDKLKDDLE